MPVTNWHPGYKPDARTVARRTKLEQIVTRAQTSLHENEATRQNRSCPLSQFSEALSISAKS